MQKDLAENTLQRSESSEHVEEWLLVDKNAATELEAANHISEPLVSASSSTIQNQKSTNSKQPSSVIKKAKVQKVDASLVLDLTVTGKHRKHLTQDSSEMAAPDEKSEEALKTQTYDAIEDSIYNELDKDHSTGSGRRVHTGNFRMKQSSGKVTAKDANDTSGSTTTEQKQ